MKNKTAGIGVFFGGGDTFSQPESLHILPPMHSSINCIVAFQRGKNDRIWGQEKKGNKVVTLLRVHQHRGNFPTASAATASGCRLRRESVFRTWLCARSFRSNRLVDAGMTKPSCFVCDCCAAGSKAVFRNASQPGSRVRTRCRETLPGSLFVRLEPPLRALDRGSCWPGSERQTIQVA